jgi:hypothetical protein
VITILSHGHEDISVLLKTILKELSKLFFHRLMLSELTILHQLTLRYRVGQCGCVGVSTRGPHTSTYTLSRSIDILDIRVGLFNNYLTHTPPRMNVLASNLDEKFFQDEKLKTDNEK